jgi:phage shock protein C
VQFCNTSGMSKTLHRSSHDKVLAGVCGGIAEYTGIDSSVLRIGMVIIVLISGVFPGLIGYMLASVIIPKGA